jgi:hypothetical protein
LACCSFDNLAIRCCISCTQIYSSSMLFGFIALICSDRPALAGWRFRLGGNHYPRPSPCQQVCAPSQHWSLRQEKCSMMPLALTQRCGQGGTIRPGARASSQPDTLSLVTGSDRLLAGAASSSKEFRAVRECSKSAFSGGRASSQALIFRNYPRYLGSRGRSPSLVWVFKQPLSPRSRSGQSGAQSSLAPASNSAKTVTRYFMAIPDIDACRRLEPLGRR